MRRLLSIATIIGLLFLLSCASTPPPQVTSDELKMVAEIQRERGERNAQIASQFLQQTKLIQQKGGRQKASEYLARIGTRYPYEAKRVRETLFGERETAKKPR